MTAFAGARARGVELLAPVRPLLIAGIVTAVLGGLMAAPHPVRAEQVPVLTAYRFLSPDTLPNGRPRPLVRDDTIDLITWWEVPEAPLAADSLHVTADFSRLDPGVAGNNKILGRGMGGGRYRVTYPLSGRVARRDSSGIRIPLEATGRTGLTLDSRIEVCLSNYPPVHLGTIIVNPKVGPYRTGDSLVIETSWRSADQLPLTISANFSDVDTSHVARSGTERSPGTFRIRYRFPLAQQEMAPDGAGKVISITARDAGCGVTIDSSLRIDVDTEPPPNDLMRLDPLPAVTTAESVFVSGYSPQSAIVFLVRNKQTRAAVDADPVTGRFGGMLDLLLGENRIQIRGEDLAGNGTVSYPPSPGVIVTRTEIAELVIGEPYSRKDVGSETTDDIIVRNPQGMTGLFVRIFNLEGDCIWEERPDPAPRLELIFHWEGTDRRGDRAPQGYYLVRAEWHAPDGKSRALTKGLLLRD